MTTHARLEQQGATLVLTFTRPEKRNAVSNEMLGLLTDAAHTLAAEQDVRTLVITGEGDYFTSGVDLAGGLAQKMAQPTPTPGRHFRSVHREIHSILDELETIEKPVVLAAQGPCLGLGVELAASCDFRFCTPATTFALPEINIGVIAGSGGTGRLVRAIGPAWTKWLGMAGRSLDAPAALRVGLVHDIYPAEAFLDHVLKFVEDMNALPAEAVGVAKIAIDAAVDTDRVTQRHMERLACTTLFGSPEFRERTARFNKAASKPES
jgi:enoyl-CoA hydratase/carnithine racemase